PSPPPPTDRRRRPTASGSAQVRRAQVRRSSVGRDSGRGPSRCSSKRRWASSTSPPVSARRSSASWRSRSTFWPSQSSTVLFSGSTTTPSSWVVLVWRLSLMTGPYPRRRPANPCECAGGARGMALAMASERGGTAPALVRSDDSEPGIRRRGRKRFSYVDEVSRRPVTRRATIERIEALAVPPAWRDVWICRDEHGHLQATGRDDRRRKQYRYHPDYRARREAEKFADLVPFGEALGPLRKQVRADLRSRAWDSER